MKLLHEITRAARSKHTHIIGGTGRGKSKLLELLVRHDIENPDCGTCVLDPHGTLATDISRYVAEDAPWLAKRIVVIDPNDLANVVGFNPLVHVDDQSINYFAMATV